MNLPEVFRKQMREILGPAYPSFVKAIAEPPRTSIRFNPLKNFNQKENYDGVKWNSDGVFLKERPIFTLDPVFHAGGYYVQEASSMFLAEAVRQCLDLNQQLRVLDLCAAPGGKSTLLASIISPESFLLANEVIRSRYNTLKYNLRKWGYQNTHSSMHDSKDFSSLGLFFDLVVVDAPCSGEGLFRKDEKAISEWSGSHVQHCAARQKRILANAVDCLKPGGVLIYCTCTYNHQENSYNAEWLAEECSLDIISLQLKPDWNITNVNPGYQFYPHKTEGEGFYICCFSKNKEQGTKNREQRTKSRDGYEWLTKKEKHLVEGWLKEAEEFHFYKTVKGKVYALLNNQTELASQLKLKLKNLETGIPIGQLKNDFFIPSPELALSTSINPHIPYLDFSKEQALRYLKKENFPLDNYPDSWALVRYEGLNLGWIKGLKNRFNNYYPMEWRIRMEVK